MEVKKKSNGQPVNKLQELLDLVSKLGILENDRNLSAEERFILEKRLKTLLELLIRE
ncbi:MAG: hypothetical protein JRI95_11880 [Deltaproteobacteria bacterium]|nr:hypothetical protein [Deltaproteobacteria bacterium]MBW2085365.1 hypothetical protein [Deltaproteobacteria bacterium]